ncbi:alpha-amylase family protein [Dictyobacter kobayashii]|uniref:Glycoside hydrolase family 42 N-terminal domain-containing protein n=1 Tax=Dictyobacter kobayashii TaxID=2014872 RepID=A0A402AXR6_9CHLR|nr:alpha-amylase family protein [Dictyobacter kobayashii]GCE23863.1 hypothetical protein KDK_76630 [Dictyobacter kobayashii]
MAQTQLCRQKNIVVFSDPAYPDWYSPEALAQLIPGEAHFVDAATLSSALQEHCELFISFHGPYFPKDAWPAIIEFLEQGGNIALFGGMPFTRPVRADGTIEAEQEEYTRQLYLGPSFALQLPETDLRLTDAEAISRHPQHTVQLTATQVGKCWSFYPKLSQVSDHPEEMGAAGPFDTLLTSLLYLDTQTSGEKIGHTAAVASLLDQQSGRFQGGRWLISPWQPATFDEWLKISNILKHFLSLTAAGATVLQARPQNACYFVGEIPTITLSSRSHQAQSAEVKVLTPHHTLLQTFKTELPGSPYVQESSLHLSAPISEPGLYTVEVCFENEQGLEWHEKTGFWYWDTALVEESTGLLLEAGRDYFYQQGTPFPLYGTTYMDSKVQRKFLAQPNPARWDSDFAEMKQAGINVIRTGIWTGWRDMMADPGRINEAALRALDAFVMTACKYQIQVIFTFFSFYPPLFEGNNPWLDPRSLQGQADFVTILARRYAQVKLLSWDLINEPSFGDPKTIFSQRPLPNYDRYEVAAFQSWLAERYSIAELQQRWRQTPQDFASWDQVSLPVADDYVADPRINGTRNMLKVMDYTFFSQDMFTRWATLIVKAIRAAGCTTIIGAGQDEAYSRISPQFYAPALDYGTTHPWWNNDSLLCDMLLDKHISHPNIIQEIGVMLVRDVDMRPLRSEQECANLLERKLITGLIGRGAGLIQWLWHTNAYMTSDNENSIGLVRPDGSAKPELKVVREIGRLIQQIGTSMIEAEQPPTTWVVIPYSQWFLRPDLALEASQQTIRILGYDLGIIPQMVGEQQLEELLGQHRPQTIILPGVQHLSESAWQALLAFVERGTTLLVSGVLGRDQHNLNTSTRIAEFDSKLQAIEPISRYEQLQGLNGRSYQFGYGGDKIAYIKKAHNHIHEYHHGEGRILWSGLPIEQSHSTDAIRAIYREALSIESRNGEQDSPYLMAQCPLKHGKLTLIVSESSQTGELELEEGQRVQVAANRAGAILHQDDGTSLYFGGVQAL